MFPKENMENCALESFAYRNYHINRKVICINEAFSAVENGLVKSSLWEQNFLTYAFN